MTTRYPRCGSSIAALLTVGIFLTRGIALAGDGCGCCRDTWAWRGDQPAFDSTTGSSLLNYPKPRTADFLHMRLEISIEDMNTPFLEATARYTVRPIGYELEELLLDARQMSIFSVDCPGRRTSFSYDSRTLKVAFDPPLPAHAVAELSVKYSLTDPAAGIIWTPESPAWPGRPAQLHTQGESEFSSYWFPCHDFPNERLTTELVVTVPAGYMVSSNGRLASRTKGVGGSGHASGGTLRPRETWRWIQDDSAGGDHVNYLVSLVVGKFDVVEIGDERGVSMPIYTPPGRGGDALATYGKTPAMLRAFERVLDEPYPWSRYAQLVVWNFGSGGMENTGCTTMYDTALIEESAVGEYNLDGLIAHEIAHQWFGNLITCNSWEHLWLNEGFASYMEAIWLENERPGRAGRDAYDADILNVFDSVIQSDKADAPNQPAMVSKAYRHSRETFRKAASPYSKGESVLHMLRRRVGDDAFFAGLRAYIDTFKHTSVETDQFRQVMEEVSGESLEQFFWQWGSRPGVPLLKLRLDWDEQHSALVVNAEQTQKIDGDNPAFALSLPIVVLGVSGERLREVRLVCDSRNASLSFGLPSRPAAIAIDPDLALLAGLDIAAPEDWLTLCATNGPTYGARVRAMRGLGSIDGTRVSQVLQGIATNPSETDSLRLEAVKCLEIRKDGDSLGAIAASSPLPSRVRAATLLALAKVAGLVDADLGSRFKDHAKSLCVLALQSASPQRVRVAAVEALGLLKANEHAGLLTQATHAESHDDLVRQAAIGAWAELGGVEGAEAVLKFTNPGFLCRTRAVAASKLSKVAEWNRAAVIARLTELLTDREFRVRIGACDALAEIKDERSIASLKGFSEGARSDFDRYKGILALEKLREAMKPETIKAD